MVDLSLAHNSPQPDENEQSQGIFTNYMQFMIKLETMEEWIAPRNNLIKRFKIND
jgi:hypothetical protein